MQLRADNLHVTDIKKLELLGLHLAIAIALLGVLRVLKRQVHVVLMSQLAHVLHLSTCVHRFVLYSYALNLL